MNIVWNALRQGTRSLLGSQQTKVSPLCSQTVAIRCSSSKSTKEEPVDYEPYQQYETPSPYRSTEIHRRSGPIKYKFYKGGYLPRPKEMADTPVKKPVYSPADPWSQKKALFGQNDYIDILGDGTVHPYQLIEGPAWARAFKGNELQRLIRRIKFEGPKLKEFYPTKYQNIQKRIFYLYKKENQRRHHANFWSGRKRSQTSRIDAPNRIK